MDESRLTTIAQIEDFLSAVRQSNSNQTKVTASAMRTDSTALAGIGHKVVMATVITAGTGKTVSEDAAFEVLVKRLADVGAWSMVIALAVELADACQLKPGLEVFGYRLVQQGSLGVAYYVSIIPFGLGLIWVGFDSKKQGWHDKLAGTVVIRDKKRGTEPVRLPWSENRSFLQRIQER